jgi:Flp pilus assembly protein TadB
MKSMRVTWGSRNNAAGHGSETVDMLRQGMSLLVWLAVWLVTMVAVVGAFVLTGVVTTLLVLVWLPCLLRSKALRRDES